MAGGRNLVSNADLDALVAGPSTTVTDGHLAVWDGATGRLLKDGGAVPGGGSGTEGPRGIPGENGVDGEDSYVPGPVGPMGLQGLRGIPGESGEDGEDSYVPGPIGATGAAGSAGAAGATGATGLQGIPGMDGDDGEPAMFNPIPYYAPIIEQYQLAPPGSVMIAAGYGAIVPRSYTIASGMHLEIRSGARMRIL